VKILERQRLSRLHQNCSMTQSVSKP
jgi:hypothetical protein